eukprot:GFYU01014429.1.p1 GENE.GFYU01014429.1~~GFYU01014429.1.p1  ORF type:complete len:569 (+),score=149.51 GFYU01014429.1:143-1849(+)
MLPTSTNMGSDNNGKIVDPSGRRFLTWWEKCIYWSIDVWGMATMWFHLREKSDDQMKGRWQWWYQAGITNGPIDLTDHQWRSFRAFLPILGSFAIGFIVLSKVLMWVHSRFLRKASDDNDSSRQNIPWARLLPTILLGGTYYVLMYGARVVFPLAFSTLSYLVAKFSGGNMFCTYVVWVINCALLYYVVQYHETINFHNIDPTLAWLDEYKGFNIRYHTSYNLLTLRIISFSMDYHWMLTGRDIFKQDKHKDSCDVCGDKGARCYHWRQECHQPLQSYNYVLYMVYLYYPPLYLAGPTVTFNAFSSQMARQQDSHSNKYIAFYGVRWLFALGVLEFLLSNLFVFDIARTKAWREYSPLGIAALGYYTLNAIWLKFLLIWRFARLWAFCDGIETPENMNRCVNNNYCFEGFWRSWHRSFNRWLIRYIYIPLGGGKRKFLVIWVVFVFVALWHEISLDLLTWAWTICLFLLPELGLKWYFSQPQWKEFTTTLAYTNLAAAGGAVTIFVMMAANLIGFSVGVEGTLIFYNKVFSFEGASVVLGGLACFYSATQLDLDQRHYEELSGKSKGF